jgi:hypothetical protein
MIDKFIYIYINKLNIYIYTLIGGTTILFKFIELSIFMHLILYYFSIRHI